MLSAAVLTTLTDCVHIECTVPTFPAQIASHQITLALTTRTFYRTVKVGERRRKEKREESDRVKRQSTEKRKRRGETDCGRETERQSKRKSSEEKQRQRRNERGGQRKKQGKRKEREEKQNFIIHSFS